jgi:hypothetical protein
LTKEWTFSTGVVSFSDSTLDRINKHLILNREMIQDFAHLNNEAAKLKVYCNSFQLAASKALTQNKYTDKNHKKPLSILKQINKSPIRKLNTDSIYNNYKSKRKSLNKVHFASPNLDVTIKSPENYENDTLNEAILVDKSFNKTLSQVVSTGINETVISHKKYKVLIFENPIFQNISYEAYLEEPSYRGSSSKSSKVPISDSSPNNELPEVRHQMVLRRRDSIKRPLRFRDPSPIPKPIVKISNKTGHKKSVKGALAPKTNPKLLQKANMKSQSAEVI